MSDVEERAKELLADLAHLSPGQRFETLSELALYQNLVITITLQAGEEGLIETIEIQHQRDLYEDARTIISDMLEKNRELRQRLHECEKG